MIEPGNARLTVSRQCELLGMSRSGYYYRPQPVSEEDLLLMRLIDEEYTRHPFFGTRRLADWLGTQGHAVGRDRVRSLMQQLGVAAIYPKKRLSLGNTAHEKYPYLLVGAVDRDAEPRLVQRHHVHPPAWRLRVPGGGDGLAQPVCAELGSVDHLGRGLLRGNVGSCLGGRAAADLQHGPGEPVHRARRSPAV